jgi:hypothetical protein
MPAMRLRSGGDAAFLHLRNMAACVLGNVLIDRLVGSRYPAINLHFTRTHGPPVSTTVALVTPVLSTNA